MKTISILLLFLFTLTIGFAQDNCNVFLMKGDSCRYEACIFLEEAPGYFQLTKEYHQIKDRAIEICPEYALIYKHKSTAYLKTGDFIGWKKLIDKAVELNPAENLDYRAWCRFQFFRDYEGAIKDVEELARITGRDVGYCQNGDYHLNVAKGLWYKMIGEKEKAIQIITEQIEKDTFSVGLYDYLHLGVLYLETKEYDKALSNLNKQSKINDLAECQYYKALTYKKLNNLGAYKESLTKAESYYLSSNYMLDTYTHHIDKVYLAEIRDEIKKSSE